MGELFVSMWEEVQRGTVRMKPHEDRNSGRTGVVSWARHCSSSVRSKVRKRSSALRQWDVSGMPPEISEQYIWERSGEDVLHQTWEQCQSMPLWV